MRLDPRHAYLAILVIAVAAILTSTACADSNEQASTGASGLDNTMPAQSESVTTTMAPTSTTTTPTSTTTTPASSTYPSDSPVMDSERVNRMLLEYSQCIRENGFPDFEDLSGDAWARSGDRSNGASDNQIFRAEMFRRGLNLANRDHAAVLEECNYITREFVGYAEISDEELAERESLLLAFSICLRANGIPDWPDPDFGANPTYGYSYSDFAPFDFYSDEFRAAGQTCDPDRSVMAIFLQ